MKKKSIFKSIALIALLVVPFMANGQIVGPNSVNGVVTQDLKLTVAGSALLAVVNTNTNATSTDIALSLTGAAVAGDAIQTEASNSDTRLRITSLNEDNKKRTITASILPSLAGTNTQLFVTLTKQASFLPAAENGGTTQPEIELTTTAADVVKDIMTCWSGTGATDGYIVTYRYAKVANATFVISRNTRVTYTISAEA